MAKPKKKSKRKTTRKARAKSKLKAKINSKLDYTKSFSSVCNSKNKVRTNYPQVAYRKCEICGDKIEEQHRTELKICYGCRLDDFLPEDYQRREEYESIASEIGKHKNARYRPKTGLDILDARSGFKCEDMEALISVKNLEGISRREALKGLHTREYFNNEI